MDCGLRRWCTLMIAVFWDKLHYAFQFAFPGRSFLATLLCEYMRFFAAAHKSVHRIQTLIYLLLRKSQAVWLLWWSRFRLTLVSLIVAFLLVFRKEFLLSGRQGIETAQQTRLIYITGIWLISTDRFRAGDYQDVILVTGEADSFPHKKRA